MTLPYGPVRNNNLFSNHWLEHRLALEPDWTELRGEAEAVLDRLGELWGQERSRVEHYAEAALAQAFIQPVLAQLGWVLIYQTHLRGWAPDYALFLTEAGKDAALAEGRAAEAFWRHPVVVGEAKAWSVDLDRPARAEGKREYPPEQIERYMAASALSHGVLTNGRLWRLYPRQLTLHQARFDTYLECDLAAILDGWTTNGGPGRQRTLERHAATLDDFLRFYLFFSPAAFRAVQGSRALLERATAGSNEYRLGIGEGLKDRVFEALETTMQGFLAHKPNRLDPATDLPALKQQSLILLYRLLFIMYAEDRGLLPYRTNRTYRENRSLSRLRDEIAERLNRPRPGAEEGFDARQTGLWEHLADLFDLVNRGHKSYGVPRYNGGLFDPEASGFLRTKALPDWHLARVIDQLGRARDPERPEAGLFRVDYRDLSIQHLGNVYEGLIELQPRCAAEPMVVVRKTGPDVAVERTIPARQPPPAGFEPTATRYEPGEVYTVADNGERKASGSYYTPNHVVDYLVEKTLGPICRAVAEELEREMRRTEEQAASARGRDRELLRDRLQTLRGGFDQRLLRLKLLDPAMGSGHFLLRACQYLAEEIATSPFVAEAAGGRAKGDEPVLTYWKRRVVEHCLYGVDLNPLAVELAKVALWLETASREEPLTFLDHHLRHGNSLVGGWVAELGALPGSPRMPLFEQAAASRLPILLDGLRQIDEMPSRTADQVKEKARLYREAVDVVREPLRAVADLWCATHFLGAADRIGADQYAQALATVAAPAQHRGLAKSPWFARAMAAARRADVACFHWELEFPEVFFDKAGRREDAGFDVILGNPPYDVLSERETGHELGPLRDFLKAQAIYEPSFRGKNNLYKLFICLGLSLLREGGRLGLIAPMAVLGDDQAGGIRKAILQAGAFTSIDAFPQKDDPARRIFRQAKLSTAMFTVLKTGDAALKAAPFISRVHPAREVDEGSPGLVLTAQEIPLYDSANLTIVSCSQEDWDLAVRITSNGRMRRLGEFAQFFQGEVNETNERAKGNLLARGEGGKLVTRGACICLYVTRPASQGEDILLDVRAFLKGRAETVKAYHHRYRRIGVQESSPQNNYRRIIAAEISRGEFCNHTVNYCPEHKCTLPLGALLALLNSKLADWYFRLGSTNAHVSHYQLRNLPCPVFAGRQPKADKEMGKVALGWIRQGRLDRAFEVLRPALAAPPFSLAVQDTIVALVRRIIQFEEARGRIGRAERSALSSAAQPYQDLIDRLLDAMAGLTDAEARGLEARLAKML